MSNVINLIDIALIKALGKKVYVTEISKKGDLLKIVMYPKAKVNVDRINELLGKYKGEMKIVIEEAPIFTLNIKSVLTKDLIICVQSVINELNLLIEN